MSRSLPSAITVQARLPCTRRSGCGGPCHDRELGSGSGEATARVWPSHEPAPVRGVGQREIVFGFARQVGIIVLTGTSRPAHMRLDLGAEQLTLEPADLRTLLGA